MITIPSILNLNIYGVTLLRLGLFFIIILSTFIIRSIFLYIIGKKMPRVVLDRIFGPDYHRLTIESIKNTIGYFIILEGFYLAIISLQLQAEFDIIYYINAVHLLIISFIVLYFIFKMIDILSLYLSKHAKDGEGALDEQLTQLLTKSLRVLVLVIGVLSILSNFGYNILSLLAGLGLGGLALALAAQTTVGNLFGSITIFSDKPFRYGDLITIGKIEGFVEEVGFRSTRVRRFDDALVIVPNSFFINQEVTNFSSMKKRRIKFDLRLSHNTTIEQIKMLLDGIRSLIVNDRRFDSDYDVNFTEFGENALIVSVNCYTKTVNPSEHLRIKEEFNFRVMELLKLSGIKLSKSQFVIKDANK